MKITRLGVATSVEELLDYLIGRDPGNIDDLWQVMYVVECAKVGHRWRNPNLAARPTDPLLNGECQRACVR